MLLLKQDLYKLDETYLLNIKQQQQQLEFRGSRLTGSLYSQNIQRGPPLVGVSWKWSKVTFDMSIFCTYDFLSLAN